MRGVCGSRFVVFGMMVTTALMTGGCGDPMFGDAFLQVTVSVENGVAGPNGPAALLVTARNVHDEPIVGAWEARRVSSGSRCVLMAATVED